MRVTCLSVSLALERSSPVSAFLAATIRGGLGYTLRGLVCANRAGKCPSCILQYSCAYAYLFESSPPVDASRLRSYRDIPRPFTIRPAQDGERVTVELTLVGGAAAYAPFFVHALNRLGSAGLGKDRVRFRVCGVRDSAGQVVYPLDGGRMATPLAAEDIVVSPGPQRTGTVTLRLLTPLAVRKDGRVVASYDNNAFFATLLRRVTNLAAFYGEMPESAVDPEAFLGPARNLAVAADTWPVRMSRISTRQERRIDYDGILGTVRLSGDIGTLMPLLRAGEVLGVGKNTVFGFGVYRLDHASRDKEE